LLTASLALLPSISAPDYLGSQVALNGSGSNVPTQTFAVSSSNPDIKATVAQGKFLTYNVSHQAAAGVSNDISFGINSPATVVVQLFDDLVPMTTSKIEGFVNQGFYNGLQLFRVANQFPGPNDYIIQGGSANNTNNFKSGLPGTPFGNEIVQQIAFTNPGQLAMANTGQPNSNDTQYFFTSGTASNLSQNQTNGFTIFGQVVSGQNVVNQMTQVALPTGGTQPVSPIVVNSETLSNTNPNGVIHIDTTQARVGETSVITVTATDPTTNTTQTQSFQVTVAPNTNTVYPITLRPVAFQGQQVYSPSSPKAIQLQASSANSGNPITYAITSQPQNGTISQFNASTGTLVYTPNPGFQGQDSLQFTVTNTTANLTSDPATVTFSTTPLPPTAATITLTVPNGTPTAVQLTGNSQNLAANQAISYALTSQPTRGTVSAFNASTGTFFYTPKTGATGTDSFQYTVTTVGAPNPGLTSQPAAVNISLVNTPVAPTAAPVSATSRLGESVKVQLQGNSQNPGANQALTYSLVSQPTKGTITGFDVNAGTFTYTPLPGASGTDTFQYMVTTSGAPNPGLASQPATVTVSIVESPIDTHAVRLVGTVLVVTPPPGDFTSTGKNVIRLSQTNDRADITQDRIQVFINGQLDQMMPADANVTQIVVYGGKQGNTITVDPGLDSTIPVTLIGGHGPRHTNIIQAGTGPTVEQSWFGKSKLIAGSGVNGLIGRASPIKFRPTTATDVIFAGMPHNFERTGRRIPPGGTFYKLGKHGRIVPIPTPPVKADFQDATPPGGTSTTTGHHHKTTKHHKSTKTSK
jgi:cyclophilin family peptidyl-prolyl cis-trans isomerase